MRILFLFCSLVLASGAFAAPGETADATGGAAWKTFAEGRRSECVGSPGELGQPLEINAGGRRYKLLGHRLIALDKDADKTLKIGVISATKDDREETLAAIDKLLTQMKKLGMEVLVVNGDVASVDLVMEDKLLPALAKAGVLVLVHVGNTESCGIFNDAMTKIFLTSKNMINANWVRQIELGSATIYTLPGYFDRRFAHTGGAARYKKEDLDALRRMIKAGPGPKVLVSHGPPMMKGRYGIDIASGAGHVGDEGITKLLERAKVPFGIFGHILEAGGRGSDLLGKRRRKQKRWHNSLYLNAGTANPDPWVMLNKKTSYGMGLFVEVKGNKARYRVLKLREP